MYHVYLLKSLVKNKTYVGFTNDINRRLCEHNAGESNYTNKYKPWKIIYKEEFNTLKEAVRKEKYYKSAAGRRKLKIIMKNMPT